MNREQRNRLNPEKADLAALLDYLGLRQTAAGVDGFIAEAARSNWPHLKFLEAIIGREAGGQARAVYRGAHSQGALPCG